MRLALEHIDLEVGGEPYLYDVDLELAPGSLNVVLGPTQAGKTSLMRIMAGLDRPSGGAIRIDGRDVTGTSVRKRNVAMVYQQFVNYPSLTVFENIASPLQQARRFSATEIDRKVRATAEMLRIDHLFDRLPAELSGGQQQRTAIARALVKEADLLLLDEPLVNLDYKLREELRAELRGLFQSRGTTVVYATTEPQEALIIGGNAVVLDAGRVLQFGPALEVYHRPKSIRVAEVFSDPPVNLLPARLEGNVCRIHDGAAFPRPQHMRAAPDGDYQVGVRADHVSANGKDSGAASLIAIVQLAEISGSETFVHAGHDGMTVIARLPGVHEYRLGERITLNLDPERTFLFEKSSGSLVAAPRHPRLERVA